jgi:hypothetical protein
MVVLRWFLAALLLWGVFTGAAALLLPFTSDDGVGAHVPALGLILIAACSWGMVRLTSARWLFTALLVWGLFTGVAYALVPLFADRGDLLTSAVGVVLIVFCAWGILRVEPHTGRRAPQPD